MRTGGILRELDTWGHPQRGGIQDSTDRLAVISGGEILLGWPVVVETWGKDSCELR